MRPLITALIILVISLPAASGGEVLYLKDGSTLKGTLIRIVDSVLVFRSSFGAEFEITRDKIARIVFSDSIEVFSSAPGPTTTAMAAAVGSLMVVFEKIDLSSKISVHRGRELEAHLAANAVKQSLWVNGAEMASHIDSTVDKEIRNGPDTEYKNSFETQRMIVALEPGDYQCEVIIRNVGADAFKESFQGRALDYGVIVDNVLIRSSATTVIRVGYKRKRLGLAQGSLVVLRN